MKLFGKDGDYSRQINNASKSKFYNGSTSLSKQYSISSVTSSNHGSLPFTYSGTPLFKGKHKAAYLRPIVTRVKSKLQAWKGKMLTIMGRIQLVNDVSGSM
jgi:hypothetical protein